MQRQPSFFFYLFGFLAIVSISLGIIAITGHLQSTLQQAAVLLSWVLLW